MIETEQSTSHSSKICEVAKPCGLINLGNASYVNAALQGLGSLVCLKDSLLDEPGMVEPVFVREMSKIFREMWSDAPQPYLEPDNVKKEVGNCNSHFDEGTENDSQEFLTVLIEMLHDGTRRMPTEAEINWSTYLDKHGVSVISDELEGQLVSSMKCGECEQFTNKYDPFMFLSVPILSEEACKLDDCLQSLFRAEVFEGKCWHCSKCSEMVDVTRRLSISRMPNTLMFYLKRFQTDVYGRRQKVQTFVEFPLKDLDLSKYATEQNGNVKYSLTAVINHSGSIGGDHYTTYGNRNNQWYHFNDETVEQCSDVTHIVNHEAYVLFYQIQQDSCKATSSYHRGNWKAIYQLELQIRALEQVLNSQYQHPEDLMPSSDFVDYEALAKIAEERAVIAQERADHAEMRAIYAEERATTAEKAAMDEQKKATAAEKRANEAERRAAANEKRAIAAERKGIEIEKRVLASEQKAAINEQRAIAAEKNFSASEEKFRVSEKNYVTLSKEIIIASERAKVSEAKAADYEITINNLTKENAIFKGTSYQTDQKNKALEDRAEMAEKRASIAEKRSKVAEDMAISTQKMVIAAVQKANITEERLIAEKESLKAENTTLTERVEEKEQQIHDLESKIAALQKELQLKVEMERSLPQEKLKTQLKCEQLETINNDLVLQYKTLKKQLIVASKRTDIVEKNAVILNERAKLLQNELVSFQCTVMELKGTLNHSEQENHALRMQLAAKRDVASKHKEELIETNSPSWVLNRKDIISTDTEIGRGSWGVVKVATFHHLEVAAKFLHSAIVSPYNQKKFEREMSIAAKIRHPNLLLFIGVTLDPNGSVHAIITELMQTSLWDLLRSKCKDKSTLTLKQLCTVGNDVSLALNYLHNMKPDVVIHRDVSSTNVLVDCIGEVWKAKLSDYGSCNFLGYIGTQGPGNANYAAPESLDPSLQTPKMDVFSFGILLLEMVTVIAPDMMRRKDQIETVTCSSMKSLIIECTAKDPYSRPSIEDILSRKLMNVDYHIGNCC